MKARNRIASISGAMALGMVLACAGGGHPRQAISAAQTALRAAESDEAQTYATAEWNTARSQLDDARNALEADDDTQARRLAEKAEAEANLAGAQARLATAQRLLENQQTTTQQLRDEATPTRRTLP